MLENWVFLFFEFWDPVLSVGELGFSLLRVLVPGFDFWQCLGSLGISNVELPGAFPVLRFLFSERERDCRE